MKIVKYSIIVSTIFLIVIFIIGLFGMGFTIANININNATINSINDNWLVVLFRINIPMSGIGPEKLGELHAIDFIIMLLMGLMFIGLIIKLKKINKVWIIIAGSFPFIGAILLYITKTAGRSGLIIAGLIYSIIMLRSKEYGLVCSIIGILGSLFLFFGGDLGTTIFSPNIIVASLILIGYVLWIIWFTMILRIEITNNRN